MTRTADLTVVTWNTHAGVQLRNGGLGWIIANLDPDVILLQEVRKFAPIRKWAKRKRWYASHRDHAGTIVLARKSRFELVDRSDEIVSRGPLNRGMQPQRRLTTMTLRDKVTGRTVDANSLHTWAMGKGLARANVHVRSQHVLQVQASAEWAETQPADHVVLVGGDLNEDMRQTLSFRFRSLTAISKLGKAGLVPAHMALGQRPAATTLHGRSVLDEVFVRRAGHTSVKRRSTHTVPRPGGDHRAVRVVLRIKAL